MMTETEKTRQLFERWPQAKDLVELAEDAGWRVEETERDVLTLRKDNQVATVGLKFRNLSQELTLFASPIGGGEKEYSLAPDAATVLRDLSRAD